MTKPDYFETVFSGPAAPGEDEVSDLQVGYDGEDGPDILQWQWDLNDLLSQGQITSAQYNAASDAGLAATEGKSGMEALNAAGLAIKKLLPDVWPFDPRKGRKRTVAPTDPRRPSG